MENFHVQSGKFAHEVPQVVNFSPGQITLAQIFQTTPSDCPPGLPPEILDLPHLPKMLFKPIFRQKKCIFTPQFWHFFPKETLNLKQKHVY